MGAATDAWRSKVRRRRERRWVVGIAASALIAVIALLLVDYAPQTPVRSAARTDRLIGTVEVRTAGGAWTVLRGAAIDLHGQTGIRTQSGSLAGIVLADGGSLRLAGDTHIVLESSSRVHLLNGKIYLDTGAAPTVHPVEVTTSVGSAIDVGTQFEVLYRNDAYRLRVREGRVKLSRGAGAITSTAGEQVTIDPSGAVARAQLKQVDKADWQWTQALAPPPDIDGQPLSVLLTWVARETGRAVRFDKPEIERRVQSNDPPRRYPPALTARRALGHARHNRPGACAVRRRYNPHQVQGRSLTKRKSVLQPIAKRQELTA